MHSLTKCSNDSHPICPKIKQIQCLSKLVWVLQYCFESSLLRASITFIPFLLRIRYIILYLLKREISSLSNNPKKPFYLQIYSSLFSAKKALNSSLLNGAAGYLVQKYYFPYLSFKSNLLTFYIAISQVHRSQLHQEFICLVQSSSSQGRKQLAKASADQCLDRLLSFQSLTTAIKKSLRMGNLSSLSCPRVYNTQCESRTDSAR